MSNLNNVNNHNEDDVSQYYPTDDTYNDGDDVFYSYNDKKKEKSKFKMTKFTSSQIIVLAIIFIIYTAVIFTAAWLIFYRPAQPSNNNIPFDTTPVEDATNNRTEPPLDNKETTTPSESTSVVVNDDYTIKDGMYNILVVGRDDAATLADVTMIVNLDTKNNQISIMQIPRDTLVNVNVPTNKVNAAYSSYFSSAYKDGDEDPYLSAAEHYAALYEQNLCINIHHTVVVNLAGFVNIVNLFGGVDVYVPEAMYYSDPEQDLYINIGVGQQHLDGYNAMCFVRYRSGYVQADLGRVNAQKIFLTAFFRTVKNSISLTNIGMLTDVANEVFKNVHTDMSVSDMIFYAKQLLSVNLDAIHMMTLPGNAADYEYGGSYYVMNRAAALEVINEYFNIYQTAISDSIFDRNTVFCITSSTSICNTYYAAADAVLDGVYNAEDIDSESIYIPHLN